MSFPISSLHLPEEESTSSMASGLLRSFCDQTPYCRSLYLLKPVVKRRPVSPRYTTCKCNDRYESGYAISKGFRAEKSRPRIALNFLRNAAP